MQKPTSYGDSFFEHGVNILSQDFHQVSKKRKERVLDISTHQEITKTNLKTPFESQNKISSLEFPNLLNFHFIENRQKFIGFCLSFCFSFKKARTPMPLNYK